MGPTDGFRVALGIEVVPTQNSPQQNSVRYCENKVSPDALERVRKAIATHVSPEPKLVVLDPGLCGKVHFNHFELWFARRVSRVTCGCSGLHRFDCEDVLRRV
jgi:hypothetical protein